MMNIASFKEVTEIKGGRFAESPLGKMAETKSFDKSIDQYDKPLSKPGEGMDTGTKKYGGSYGELKQQDGREGKEIHHMPADSASPFIERNDGPAIEMEESDHRKTASCGNSRDAQEYRAAQKELITQGKFREAFEMDVEDIREKFGDKYDYAIIGAITYLNKLDTEGKI